MLKPAEHLLSPLRPAARDFHFVCSQTWTGSEALVFDAPAAASAGRAGARHRARHAAPGRPTGKRFDGSTARLLALRDRQSWTRLLAGARQGISKRLRGHSIDVGRRT